MGAPGFQERPALRVGQHALKRRARSHDLAAIGFLQRHRKAGFRALIDQRLPGRQIGPNRNALAWRGSSSTLLSVVLMTDGTCTPTITRPAAFAWSTATEGAASMGSNRPAKRKCPRIPVLPR